MAIQCLVEFLNIKLTEFHAGRVDGLTELNKCPARVRTRQSKNMRPLRIMDRKYNCITQYLALVAGK